MIFVKVDSGRTVQCSSHASYAMAHPAQEAGSLAPAQRLRIPRRQPCRQSGSRCCAHDPSFGLPSKETAGRLDAAAGSDGVNLRYARAGTCLRRQGCHAEPCSLLQLIFPKHFLQVGSGKLPSGRTDDDNAPQPRLMRIKMRRVNEEMLTCVGKFIRRDVGNLDSLEEETPR